jgi:hypothetical protein
MKLSQAFKIAEKISARASTTAIEEDAQLILSEVQRIEEEQEVEKLEKMLSQCVSKRNLCPECSLQPSPIPTVPTTPKDAEKQGHAPQGEDERETAEMEKSCQNCGNHRNCHSCDFFKGEGGCYHPSGPCRNQESWQPATPPPSTGEMNKGDI